MGKLVAIVYSRWDGCVLLYEEVRFQSFEQGLDLIRHGEVHSRALSSVAVIRSSSLL